MAGRPYVLRGWNDELQRGTEYEVFADLLAEVSTHRDDHVRLVHGPGEYAAEGDRCSACRWFEAQLYREVEGTKLRGWIVQTVGRSIVPGEDDRYRLHFCDSPRRVIAKLVQTRDGEVFVPHTAKRLLDDAAEVDAELAVIVDELLEDGLAS